MKTTKIERLKASKQSKQLTDIFIEKDYTVNTLINGNISECITYLKDLIECGNVGIGIVYEELSNIRELSPARYDYIKNNVFNTISPF